MDKIKRRSKDGITWYDNEDIVDKVHELVRGYDKTIKRLEKMDKRIEMLYHNDVIDAIRKIG